MVDADNRLLPITTYSFITLHYYYNLWGLGHCPFGEVFRNKRTSTTLRILHDLRGGLDRSWVDGSQ